MPLMHYMCIKKFRWNASCVWFDRFKQWMKYRHWVRFHLSLQASTSPPANQVRGKKMYAVNICANDDKCEHHRSVSVPVRCHLCLDVLHLSLSFSFLSHGPLFPSICHFSSSFFVVVAGGLRSRYAVDSYNCQDIRQRQKEKKNAERIINVAVRRNFRDMRNSHGSV